MEIDGITIEREESPSSIDEMSNLLGQAYGDNQSVVILGGGTQLHLGNPPKSAQIGVHTAKLNGIIEYEPGNLTVSVLPGTTLQNLQETLGFENQFLPLDPPSAERATIGGIFAANSSGPIRFRYGTGRDMLIGVRMVQADGTPTHAGGKLVKNVTGYDMCKLYTGSLGTLGIFGELTLKVQPKSDAVATVLLAYPSFHCLLEATQACLRADLTPDAIEAVNANAFSDLTGEPSPGPWVLMLRFGETDAAVRWQVDRAREAATIPGSHMLSILHTAESEAFWAKASSARDTARSESDLWLKCSVLFQPAPEIERHMTKLGERLEAPTRLYCHAGIGILYGRYDLSNSARPFQDLKREILELRHECVSGGGHLVVEKVRRDVKQSLDVWGYEAPALKIMRALKSQFDPKGLLNPGRFVGGI